MEIAVPEDIAAMENLSVYSAESEPQYQLELERLATYGDTDDVFLSNITTIDVDDAGRVILADGRSATMYVYNQSGEITHTMGGSGQGPGEFTSINSIQIVDGTIYALDLNQRRFSRFNADGFSFINNIPIADTLNNSSNFPVSFSPISGNRFVLMMSGFSMTESGGGMATKPYVIDNTGTVINEVGIEVTPTEFTRLQNNNTIQMMVMPHSRSSLSAVSPSDEIVHGYTDRFWIQFSDLNGNYLRSIYYDLKNQPLNQTEFLSNYEDEEVRKAIRQTDIPDTYPAFSSLQVDDSSRIWVTLINTSGDDLTVWVLDSSGEKLAELTYPSSRRLVRIKGDRVYFQEENEMGAVELVEYQINWI